MQPAKPAVTQYTDLSQWPNTGRNVKNIVILFFEDALRWFFFFRLRTVNSLLLSHAILLKINNQPYMNEVSFCLEPHTEVPRKGRDLPSRKKGCDSFTTTSIIWPLFYNPHFMSLFLTLVQLTDISPNNISLPPRHCVSLSHAGFPRHEHKIIPLWHEAPPK